MTTHHRQAGLRAWTHRPRHARRPAIGLSPVLVLAATILLLADTALGVTVVILVFATLAVLWTVRRPLRRAASDLDAILAEELGPRHRRGGVRFGDPATAQQ
ncbi:MULTISPECIES: hypothetical protein [unclassified Amycolatopsis]|uniref:hypothetical protein n=1 Tax=unclassified Amycolatopsis TaxID=2618356 RepID=UPI002E232430|nr:MULTISPECIES: hypothetical protein [unclassified Amycolatopsis]